MSNDFVAAVTSVDKTLYGHIKVVPMHTTSFVSFNNETEAHYLCAILNSMPVREFVKSYSAAGRGFGSPSVIKNVGIPKFDDSDSLHIALSEHSQRLHELANGNENYGSRKLELEIDSLVEQLFGI